MSLDRVPNKECVLSWMKTQEHIETATQLAEAAAYEFEQVGWLGNETHWVWDIAVEAIEYLEKMKDFQEQIRRLSVAAKQVRQQLNS